MKKVTIIPALLISLSITGCFKSTKTLEEYKTPELFLSHSTIVFDYITIYSSKDMSKKTMDYEFAIKNEILASGPFKEVNGIQPKTDRYFTYEILRSLSTAGPNICKMHIYDDGCINIYAKDALAKQCNAFYTMDPEKAYHLNDFVEEKIEEAQEREEQAEIDDDSEQL